MHASNQARFDLLLIYAELRYISSLVPINRLQHTQLL
jgi:hypothetical protein